MTEHDRADFPDDSLLDLFGQDYQTTNGSFGLYMWDPSSGEMFMVREDGTPYHPLDPRGARRRYPPPNPYVTVEYVAPDDGQPYETPDGRADHSGRSINPWE